MDVPLCLACGDHPHFVRSFHQSEPEQLVRLQSEHWHPLIQWVKDEFGVEISIFDSILSVPQPAETVAKLDVILQGMNAWELAGKLDQCLFSL
jgi:chaperone required for assembly of F1-ATPase